MRITHVLYFLNRNTTSDFLGRSVVNLDFRVNIRNTNLNHAAEEHSKDECSRFARRRLVFLLNTTATAAPCPSLPAVMATTALLTPPPCS